MIATRISKNEDALADYGVAIYDTAGNLRSTYDILVDLAPKWEQMSKAEQVALGNTLAGTNQYKILAAVLSQMDVAQEAYKQALDSTGETMKQNAVYMESLEARTTALKAEWENFVLGNGGLQDCAKVFVSIATNVVKLINNLGGLPPVLTTITGLLIGINALKIASTITNLFTSIQNGLQNIIYAIPNAISAWKAYAANVVTANTAMQASAPLIGLVATALGLVVSGIMVHNRKLEEQKKAIKENIAAFSEEYKALEDVSEKLKNENITREELDNIISSNLDSYEAERLKLLDNNEARKEAINLIEEEKKARAQELVDTGLSTYEESLENLEKGYDEFDKWFYTRRESYSKGILEKAGVADAKTASEQIKSLKNLRLLLIEARSEAIKRGEDRDSLGIRNITKEIEELEGLIGSLNESFEKDTEIINNYNDSLETLGKYYKTSTKEIVNGSKKSYIAIEEERKGREKLSYANKKSVQELDELQKKYNITEQAIYDYIDANQEENITREDAIEALALEAEAQIKSGEALGDLDKRYEDLLSSSKDVVSSISKVSSALQEQSKNGSLAVETQLELIEAGYGAALMYDKETGACKLDEKAVQALVEAKLEMQIANLQIARSDIVSKLMAEANAAVVSAGAFLELAKAKNLANQAVLDYSGKSGGRSAADPSKSTSGYGGNFGYLAIDAEKATNQIDTLNSEIDALKSSLKGIKTSGIGAFDGVKSGAKSAKSATDDLNKSLEETKKKYDTVIKWISKQYDKEIDNIKKAEKEALKAEEAKIKAKEKEKDKALDAIEAEINALEKEKDARKKYWDDQIDALKKQNDATKDALELQEKLDALERAKNTRVKIYKEGQGFVYDVDQTAVAEAQKELDEYLSEKAYEDELARLEALRDAEIDNYEQRIDAMNEYKDNVQANYEAQIKALNAHKEQLQEQYEAEIEMYENYKQQFEDMVNAYEEEQNRLLAQQLTGIDFENKNWMTRLDNLAAFVNEYNKLQKQLDTGNTSVSNSASMKSGGSASSSSGRSSGNALKSSGSTKVGYVPTSVTKAISKQTGQKDTSGRVYLHSSGADSIKDDEIAIVGENPNKEIVIGSKINNGQLMSLDKGTGVVNAESSKTLASMLNQVGQFGASGFGSGNGTLNNNINNDSLVVNGVTIQGANIKDPETFVNGLLNLKAEALQRAYKHR